MSRVINHLLILLLVFNAAAAITAAQDRRVIGRIEFEGLKQTTPDEALATSGLKLEQPFKVEDIDAAAQRLLDSGIFKQLGYRTRTVGNKVTIVFQVEETVGGDAPVIFDNFIWFSEEQLLAAVRKEVPTFAGRAPNAGKMPEAITHALQQLLTEQKLAGTVEYVASQDLAAGRIISHVFSVAGVKLPICTFHFPGAQNVSEAKLVSVSKGELADADYSSEVLRGFAGMRLFALYREVGQLRAKFSAPVGKPDSTCKNGVDLTIPVSEGLIYSWAQTDWTGATAFTAEQLNKTLGMTQGDVANGLKFDSGLSALRKAYGRQGYLDAAVRPQPEFDDSAQKVTYKIEVREGPQYRMGSLLFKGFAERDAKALRDAWSLRRGEVFDEGYVKEDFYTNDAGRALRSLFEERRALGKPPPQIATKLTPHKDTLTIDVTLELAN